MLQKEAEGEPGGPAGEGQSGNNAGTQEQRRLSASDSWQEGVHRGGVPQGRGHPLLARVGHSGEPLEHIPITAGFSKLLSHGHV